METHPIIFSTTMVQAILEGRKTMTRRVIKPQPYLDERYNLHTWDGPRPKAKRYTGSIASTHLDGLLESLSFHGKYQPGDVLWVRETYQTSWNEKAKKWEPIYKADGGVWIDDDGMVKWKPSIHMPKAACRIFLEVTSIRVERLQDITYVDGIIQEGYPKEHPGCSPIEWFENLWAKINGQDSWNSNPWVWVIEFKRIDKPENF